MDLAMMKAESAPLSGAVCHALWERFSGQKEWWCGQDTETVPDTAVRQGYHTWSFAEGVLVHVSASDLRACVGELPGDNANVNFFAS